MIDKNQFHIYRHKWEMWHYKAFRKSLQENSFITSRKGRISLKTHKTINYKGNTRQFPLLHNLKKAVYRKTWKRVQTQATEWKDL